MPLIPEDELGIAIRNLFQTRGPLPVSHEADPGEESPPDGGIPLETVLAGRRSVREFTGEAVAAGRLLDVLSLAAAFQARQWPSARHGDAGLWTLIAAHRVDGIEDGLHIWEGTGEIRPAGTAVRPADPAADATGAAAVVMICGSVRHTGGPAYGGLLVRAGALGHAICLAARTRGLDCRPFDGAGYEVTGIAGEVRAGHRHLFTVAIGHGADEFPMPAAKENVHD
ncbi:nitroreductase family protein [Spirillospora sp. NBC_00431]